MRINIKNLKKLRDYIESGEWKKRGRFDMFAYWINNLESHIAITDNEHNYKKNDFPCGCLSGHAFDSGLFKYGKNDMEKGDYEDFIEKSFGIAACSCLSDFLFCELWKEYDNTPEGAIGRIDAVIDGLRF